MSATWMHLLEQLEPTYFKWKDMLDNGPTISATLDKRKVRWWVCIHEDWGDTPADQQYQYYTASDSKLQQRIDWTEEQLKDWKYVSRQSWQHWAFLRKHDAEKFITLFNIKWS
jgi:hypothetical protein